MYLSKEKSVKKQIAPNCYVYEYPLNNKQLWFATAEINWRFPEQWRITNTICQEIYYVASWKGKLTIEWEEVILNKWDVYLIEPNKKYFVEWENLNLCLPTFPEWYIEQVEMI